MRTEENCQESTIIPIGHRRYVFLEAINADSGLVQPTYFASIVENGKIRELEFEELDTIYKGLSASMRKKARRFYKALRP